MTEPKFKRVFAIVLDSVGTGNAPDAAKFDDEGPTRWAILVMPGRVR